MEQPDNVRERVERWEKENNRQMSSLTRKEWLDVITEILPLTRIEAEEWLNQMIMNSES